MAEMSKKLKDLRVADLKAELESRGLVASGIKAVLTERLKEALEDEGKNPEEHSFDNNKEEDTCKDVDEPPTQEEGGGVVDTNAEEPSGPNEDDSEGNINGTVGGKIDVEDNDGVEAQDGPEDDSLNIMIGDEDNLFDEDEKKDLQMMAANGLKRQPSPPRPESVPAKHPFTSKDTINLGNRGGGKAPSDNSSMLVNPDESQSVASHDSTEGIKDMSDKKEDDEEDKGENKVEEKTVEEKKEKSEEEKKNATTSSRNLWVSGLSSSTRATDLKTTFSKYGKVIGAKVVTNARTPGARCYGYVTMNCSEDANSSIKNLNRTELHGRMITVERAKVETAPSKENSSSSKSGEDKDKEVKVDGNKEKMERQKITAPEGGSGGAGRSSRPSSTSSPQVRRGEEKGGRHSGGVLTFNQIRDQRKRELEKEEERRRRDRERRKREEEDRRRAESSRRQREEEDRLRRERDELRREREKLEQEKRELMKYERERQRMERERLEREKEELERLKRQHSTVKDGGGGERRGSKRPGDERDPYYDERKRSTGHREDYSRESRGTRDHGSSSTNYYDGNRGGGSGGGASSSSSRHEERSGHGGGSSSSRGFDGSSRGGRSDGHGGGGGGGHGGGGRSGGDSYRRGGEESSRPGGGGSVRESGHGSSRPGGSAWSHSSSSGPKPGGATAAAYSGSSTGGGGYQSSAPQAPRAPEWGGSRGGSGVVAAPSRPLLTMGGGLAPGIPTFGQPMPGAVAPFGGMSGTGGSVGRVNGDRFDAYNKNAMMNQRRY